MSRMSSLFRPLVSPVALLLLAPLGFTSGVAQTPSYKVISAPFTVDTPTAVPSHTLAPGTYSIRVLDSFDDRFILRIDDSSDKAVATIIGLRNPEFAGAYPKGPITWNSAAHKNSSALRGFSFSPANTLEFVYPKDEAVALAKVNSDSVPAIDPESEGRPPDPKLTEEDRQIVTLWMLTAIRVGPKDGTPAIEAKRFKAASGTSLVASATAPPALGSNASAAAATPPASANVATSKSPARLSADPTATRSKSRAISAKLPQTASDLPAILLLSTLFLLLAGGMRLGRKWLI